MTEPRLPEGAFATLRRFIRPRTLVERCDLCGIELAAKHQHLMASSSQQLLCACAACAVLFSYRHETPYRRVPQRIGRLSNFRLTDAQWESLMIPIGMAFFFHNTTAGKIVAIYPSPAGPTESLLDLASWDAIEQDNPVLRHLEPDVEALLVNRVGLDRRIGHFRPTNTIAACVHRELNQISRYLSNSCEIIGF